MTIKRHIYDSLPKLYILDRFMAVFFGVVANKGRVSCKKYQSMIYKIKNSKLIRYYHI
jgi:hypothetical protein